MEHLTTSANIVNFFENKLTSHITNWHSLLMNGKMYEFEKTLMSSMLVLYDEIAKTLMQQVAEQLQPMLKEQAHKQGCKKIVERQMSIRLGTGHSVVVKSEYAKKVPSLWKNSRHFLAQTIGAL